MEFPKAKVEPIHSRRIKMILPSKIWTIVSCIKDLAMVGNISSSLEPKTYKIIRIKRHLTSDLAIKTH